MHELGLLSAYANAVGSAGAMPILCRILAQQGLLTATDIEALRHAALIGYDKVREQPGFPAALSLQVEEARKIADAMWQQVALTVDKQAPQQAGPRAAVSKKARRTKVPK